MESNIRNWNLLAEVMIWYPPNYRWLQHRTGRLSNELESQVPQSVVQSGYLPSFHRWIQRNEWSHWTSKVSVLWSSWWCRAVSSLWYVRRGWKPIGRSRRRTLSIWLQSCQMMLYGPLSCHKYNLSWNPQADQVQTEQWSVPQQSKWFVWPLLAKISPQTSSWMVSWSSHRAPRCM